MEGVWVRDRLFRPRPWLALALTCASLLAPVALLAQAPPSGFPGERPLSVTDTQPYAPEIIPPGLPSPSNAANPPGSGVGPPDALRGETILDVRIVGNDAVPLQKINSLIRTRADRPFDRSIVEEDVRRMNRERLFLDVKATYQRPESGGVIVTFEVVERPLLRYVKYLGNQKVTDKALTEECDLKVGNPLDPYSIDDARRKIEDLYKRKNFNNTEVEVLEGNRPGDRGAVFMIHEGQRQKFKDIRFVGNTIAVDARLKTQIQSKEPFLWLFRGFVDREKIDGDVDRLTAYYRSLGFFQARIAPELEWDDAQSKLTLTFVIDEGIRYQVRNVSVTGNLQYASPELIEALTLKSGEFFNQGKMNRDVAILKDYYGVDGYIFTDVQADPRFLDEPGQLDLVYNIAEGDRYRVGRIDVQIAGDNPHTRIRTVMNRLSFQPGEYVNTRKLQDSERRLRASQLFAVDPARNVAPKIVLVPPDPDESREFARRPASKSGSFRGQSPDPMPQVLPNGDRVMVVKVHGDWLPEAKWPRGGLDRIAPPPAQLPMTEYPTPAVMDSQSTGARTLHAPRLNGDQPAVVRGQSPDLVWRKEPTRSQPVRHLEWSAERSQPGPAVAVDESPGSVPIHGSEFSPFRQVAQRGSTVRAQSPAPAGNDPWMGYPGYRSGGQTAQAPAAPQRQGSLPNQAHPTTIPEPQYTAQGAGPPPRYNGPVIEPAAPNYQGGPPLPGQFSPDRPPTSGSVFEVTPGDEGGSAIISDDQPEPYVNIVPRVEETRTGRMMLGVGVNSDAGAVASFMVEEQNFDICQFPTSFQDLVYGGAFRGAGQRLRLEAVPGTEVQRYMFNFSEPYLFDTNISFGLSGFLFDRRYDDWDEGRVGGQLSLGYQIRPDLSVTASLRGEDVKIRRPRTPTPPELLEVLGHNDLYKARVAIAHDTRDSAFLPTEGHLVEFAYEQAFGEFHYPRGTIDLRQYFLIRERPDTSGRHVLGVSGQIGVSGDDTPVFEHFFAGGTTTLRGFDFRGASPRNMGTTVGGEFQILTSVEYLMPVTADDALRVVFFCDAGTVEEDVRVVGRNIRVAPGIGLRITVPALGPAPIALDLAVPVARAEGDDIQNFSFRMGIFR